MSQEIDSLNRFLESASKVHSWSICKIKDNESADPLDSSAFRDVFGLSQRCVRVGESLGIDMLRMGEILQEVELICHMGYRAASRVGPIPVPLSLVQRKGWQVGLQGEPLVEEKEFLDSYIEYLEERFCGRLAQLGNIREALRERSSQAPPKCSAEIPVPMNAQPHAEGAVSRSAAVRPATVEESNRKAMELAQDNPSLVKSITARELSRRIGCSLGLIPRLPFWRELMRQSGRGRNGRAAHPTAVSFTEKVESSIGEMEPELQRLVEEQEADAKQHPLRSRQRI